MRQGASSRGPCTETAPHGGEKNGSALEAMISSRNPPEWELERGLPAQPEDPFRQPPSDLGPVGRALWEGITWDHKFRDASSYQDLAQACRCLDLAQQCRTRIAADGSLIRTKYGYRDNPLVMRQVSAIAVCLLTLRRLEDLCSKPAWGRRSGTHAQPSRPCAIDD